MTNGRDGGCAGGRKENRLANGGPREIGHFPGAAGADHWRTSGFVGATNIV